MKQKTRRLFIARLPFEATAKDLADYFVQFGEITDVYCPKDPNNPSQNKGFGFVSFQNVISAQKAITSGSHLIIGREIVIDYALVRPAEEIQTYGSAEPFISYQQNYYPRDLQYPSMGIMEPYSGNYERETIAYDHGPSRDYNRDTNGYRISDFGNYNNYENYAHQIILPQLPNQYLPAYEDSESSSLYPNSTNYEAFQLKDTPIPIDNHILNFKLQMKDIKNDSFSTYMKFSKSDKITKEGSNLDDCLEEASTSNPDNLHTPLDAYPSIILKQADEQNKSQFYPATIEFNIHLPTDLIEELLLPNNIDKFITCKFKFSTDFTDHENKSDIGDLTSYNYKQGSQHIHIANPVSSTQNPSNHTRNTKRPPGGNVWIKRGHRIYVGQLGPTTSSEDLKQYFQQFGEVVDAYIPKEFPNGISRGFGFVTFLEPGVAEELITNSSRRNDQINGYRITISKARPS